MTTRPLAPPPTQSPVLEAFCSHFGVVATRSPRTNVANLARAFARIPYENLTKILRHAAAGRPVYRTPGIVVAEHRELGTGGTCFSLTTTLVHLVRALGMRAEPILADRPYGADTHSAVLVWLDDLPHLIDPGYLITDPIPLADPRPVHLRTSFNELHLTPTEAGRWDLATSSQGKRVHRLSWKIDPADESMFMKAWDASFDWEMMHDPVLSRIVDGAQIYLHRQRLLTRQHERSQVTQVPLEHLARQIAASFQMKLPIVEEALRVLESRGDLSTSAKERTSMSEQSRATKQAR